MGLSLIFKKLYIFECILKIIKNTDIKYENYLLVSGLIKLNFL